MDLARFDTRTGHPRRSSAVIYQPLGRLNNGTPQRDADALLAQVVDLRDKALGVLEQAEASEDLRTAVSAIRELRRQ